MKTLKEFAESKVEDYIASKFYKMGDLDFGRIVDIVIEAEQEWLVMRQEADEQSHD